MLDMPVTPPQPSLTHLIHPLAGTPSTTASDTSYIDESNTPQSSIKSKEEKIIEKRVTRSQENKSVNKELEQTIKQAKKLGHN